MKIVGVGCGPGQLTPDAVRSIAGADEVFGSARAIALALQAIRPGCPVHEICDYRALRSLGPGAVVLSTGDPMLSGLGYLPGEIVPGISSLQVALARLHLSWTRVTVLSAHGRDHAAAISAAVSEVRRERVAFLVADPTFPVPLLGKSLKSLGEGIRVAVCENLGYPEERVEVGIPSVPPVVQSSLFVVLCGRF